MDKKNLKNKIIDILKKQCKEDNCYIKIDNPTTKIMKLLQKEMEKRGADKKEMVKEIEEWIVGKLPAFPPKNKVKELLKMKLFSAEDIKAFLNKL